MEQNAKQRILDTAVGMAAAYGWKNLKRDAVARAAACSTGLVNAHFNTMDALRSEVMRTAIARKIHPIMLEGLAHKHPLAMALPHDVRVDLVMR